MIHPLIEQPYLVQWQNLSLGPEAPNHLFCGAPSSETAQCPNCRKPLMRMLSLDLSDQRLGLTDSGLGRLELLFCWPCGISREPFFYKAQPGGAIRIVQAGKGLPEEDFPYEDYPRSFPETAAQLVEMPSDLRDLIVRYAELSASGNDELDEWDLETRFRAATPRHQIGGIPFLFEYDSLSCPECDKPMDFLATIGDENSDPRGFVGNEFVQIVYFYCPLCRLVGARQETD